MKKLKIGKHEIGVVESMEELVEVLTPSLGTSVEIVTPQFMRKPGALTPSSPPDWSALGELDFAALREMGCSVWCDPAEEDWPHDETLLLFPGEWYSSIPLGTKIVDIFGNEESFIPGKTDDDVRFGCLAFGVLR